MNKIGGQSSSSGLALSSHSRQCHRANSHQASATGSHSTNSHSSPGVPGIARQCRVCLPHTPHSRHVSSASSSTRGIGHRGSKGGQSNCYRAGLPTRGVGRARFLPQLEPREGGAGSDLRGSDSRPLPTESVQMNDAFGGASSLLASLLQ
jgi:hypothetical protein